MSASKQFINKKVKLTDGENDSLGRIRRILSEADITPDLSFFRSKSNRQKTAKQSPNSFLKQVKGNPTFPVRNQHGGVSYTILKRSIIAAKAKYTQTGDSSYLDIIQKLEVQLNQVEKKVNVAPRTYKPETNLVSGVLTKYGTLGSPYKK